MNVKPNRPIISDNSNCVFFVRLVSILMKFVLNAKHCVILVYNLLLEHVSCINGKQRSIKRAIFIITIDYEEESKKCSSIWKKKLKKTIDSYLALVNPLPDAPHIVKSLKAFFSNWYLTLFYERACLSFLHTLRNNSAGFIVLKLIRESTKFLKANKIGMFLDLLSLSLGTYVVF